MKYNLKLKRGFQVIFEGELHTVEKSSTLQLPSQKEEHNREMDRFILQAEMAINSNSECGVRALFERADD